MKSDRLEVKFDSNVSEVTEEIAGCGNVDTAVVWTPLDVQPEELSKGEPININEESRCDEASPEEATPGKYFKLKKLLDISWHSKCKGKNVESHQGIEKMWREALFKLLLIKFFTKQ